MTPDPRPEGAYVSKVPLEPVAAAVEPGAFSVRIERVQGDGSVRALEITREESRDVWRGLGEILA